MSVDRKVVKVRQDFDITKINKELEKKADHAETKNQIELNDFKIGALDANLILLARDLEAMQRATNGMR